MSEEPLSTELSEWADGAEEGLVIFCLGHTIHLGRYCCHEINVSEEEMFHMCSVKFFGSV